jgi:hypothetical protein
MDISKELRDWVQTLGVVGIVVGAFVGIYQYKLSVKAEQRQHASAQAEVDCPTLGCFRRARANG